MLRFCQFSVVYPGIGSRRCPPDTQKTPGGVSRGRRTAKPSSHSRKALFCPFFERTSPSVTQSTVFSIAVVTQTQLGSIQPRGKLKSRALTISHRDRAKHELSSQTFLLRHGDKFLCGNLFIRNHLKVNLFIFLQRRHLSLQYRKKLEQRRIYKYM
jgi:hypothetical protein